MEYLNADGTVLDCSGRGLLTELVVPVTAVNLRTIICDRCQLTTLVIPVTAVNLKVIHCGNNQLTELVIPDTCIHLQSIGCSSNRLKSLVIPDTCIHLLIVDVYNNKLTTLVIPETRYPIIIHCWNNRLTRLVFKHHCHGTDCKIEHCIPGHTYSTRCYSLAGLSCEGNDLPYSNLSEYRAFTRFQQIYAAAKIYHALKRYGYKYRASKKAEHIDEIPYHPLCAKFNRQSDQWVN